MVRVSYEEALRDGLSKAQASELRADEAAGHSEPGAPVAMSMPPRGRSDAESTHKVRRCKDVAGVPQRNGALRHHGRVGRGAGSRFMTRTRDRRASSST